MKVFFAWTPLHIINILNTHKSYFENDKADLFLYDEFYGAKAIYEQLEELKLFENVYLVEHKKIGNSLEQKFNLLVNRNIIFHGHEPLKNYTDFYIQGGNPFAKILFGQLKKMNSMIRLHYIEDGIGAYLNTSVFPTAGYKQKIIGGINRWSMYNHPFSSYFVYEPSLCMFESDKTKKLPMIDHDSSLLEVIKKVFNVSETFNLENKIIYLDQPLKNDRFSFDEYSLFNVIRECNQDNREILVKLHPRSKQKKYGENVSYLETQLPFELLAFTSNMNQSLVVSPLSTASFSSSMMFGFEFKTIVLSKFISESNGFSLEDRSKAVITDFNSFLNRYEETCRKGILLSPKDEEDVKNDLIL